MKQHRRKRGLILLSVGVLCLLLSGGWVGYNLWEDANAGDMAADWLSKVEQAVPEAPVDSADTPAAPLPTVVVEGERFCGRVMIDSLGIALPVFSDWSYDKLQEAPCRYTGSVATGDMVIIAHNYQSHFGDLQDLQKGDTVRFVDGAGQEHRFTVEEITRLDGTAVEDMSAGEWDLTLFTCTKDGSQRVTVRCTKM